MKNEKIKTHFEEFMKEYNIIINWFLKNDHKISLLK